jgi:hypothetical protein
MGPHGPLESSQEHANGTYPGPYESSIQMIILFITTSRTRRSNQSQIQSASEIFFPSKAAGAWIQGRIETCGRPEQANNLASLQIDIL